MENLLKAIQLKEELDQLRPIDAIQEQRIMQKFKLDWNYHSNHLEGNSLTYGETKALLFYGITAQGKPLKDHFEITGHNEAIDWVLDMIKKETPLTESFIRQLHQLLLKEPYEVDAITTDGKPTKRKITVGAYKTMPNHVKTKTGEIFYFATPEETPAKMHDLLQWYHEKINENEVNPILLAAEFHYKFIRIHPFDDGNGRTARILMNFILMQFQFPPVIIKTEDKANYFIALQLADTGNIEAFIDYIAQNLNRSLEIMIAGAKGEEIEEEDDIDKEIALLEQRLKVTNIKTENNIENLSTSMIEIMNNFYLSQSKFKKLYKNTEFKFCVNDDVFEFDRNKILKFLIDSLSKKNIYLEIYMCFNFSSFYEWKKDDVSYKTALEITFNNNNYKISINNEVILENEKLQPIDENFTNKVISAANTVHKLFIEQKITEQENKS